MTTRSVVEDVLSRKDSGSFKSPSAAALLTSTGDVRQRRWAPRVRTGCTTCRVRHIKCDETRPACRHCNISRRVCHYTLPPPIYDCSAGGSSNNGAQKLCHQKQRFITDIEPFDWEFQEALQFYFQVILPHLPPEAQKIPLSCFLDENFPRTMFKGTIISTQIERASKARGKVLQPEEDPAFKTSWARYFQSVSLHIDSVNQLLQDDTQYNDKAPATLLIFQLLLFDLSVKLSSWKAHLEGFLAYMESRGGPSKLMRLRTPEKSCLSHILSFNMQLNTTCPAHKQIKRSDIFSDAEIKSLIDFDPHAFEPCPTEFHLSRVRLTRLRVSLAGNRFRHEHDSVTSNVQDILDTIWLFDIDQYIEQQFGDKGPEVQAQARIMGRVYAVAIRLYGILTLPQSSIAAWAVSSPGIQSSFPLIPGCTLYESLRRRHRDELLGMMREQWGSVRLNKWLAWPLTVAGVAVVDDAIEHREFVDESLFSIWKITETHTSFIAVLEKLRIFWSSGRTRWEDCFDEPIPYGIW